jgi:hypothetical protein
MSQSLRTTLVSVAFTGSVAIVLLVLDWNLASRVIAAVEDARSYFETSPEVEPDAYRMTGVAADLCGALTGTIAGSWILPRTRGAMRQNPFDVHVEGNRCRRGRSNHALVFTPAG